MLCVFSYHKSIKKTENYYYLSGFSVFKKVDIINRWEWIVHQDWRYEKSKEKISLDSAKTAH